MLPRKGCSCVVHSRHPSKDGHPGRPGRELRRDPAGHTESPVQAACSTAADGCTHHLTRVSHRPAHTRPCALRDLAWVPGMM